MVCVLEWLQQGTKKINIWKKPQRDGNVERSNFVLKKKNFFFHFWKQRSDRRLVENTILQLWFWCTRKMLPFSTAPCGWFAGFSAGSALDSLLMPSSSLTFLKKCCCFPGMLFTCSLFSYCLKPWSNSYITRVLRHFNPPLCIEPQKLNRRCQFWRMNEKRHYLFTVMFRWQLLPAMRSCATAARGRWGFCTSRS